MSDVLVSSIPNCKDLQKFIDKEYKKFLLELNIQLRSLSPIDIHSRNDIVDIRVINELAVSVIGRYQRDYEPISYPESTLSISHLCWCTSITHSILSFID